jgi:hypothetical protein
MQQLMTRRAFFTSTAAAAIAPAFPGRLFAEASWPKVPDHTLTVVKGKPRERGRQYGKQFAADLAKFLDKEIVTPFSKRVTRDDMLRYAGQCAKEVRAYSPEIHDELEGMAEGAGVRLEDVVAITLHEEFYHQGILPMVEHCTAFAAGPPNTDDRHAYVGQTWDWYVSLFGASTMLLWQRAEGPSVLAYAYPGLWVGAGMNSEGIALCWTSAEGKDIAGPRVGVPSYVLIAQMLYQKSLKDALEEARRAKHAGWFTFVLGDGEGRLANVEGSPKELAIEEHKGHLVRSQFGSRKMTNTPQGQPVKYIPKVQKMYEVLGEGKSKWNAANLKELLTHKAICLCEATNEPRQVRTIDAMLFDTTKRQALVTRAPIGSRSWTRFGFEQG